MESKFYNTIVVCVVYRSMNDLDGLIKTLNDKVKDYKLIFVNNHYSDEIDALMKNYALKNNADIINSPNDGYGSGNNLGIEYAKNNYEFNYLIICNSDIEIKQYNEKLLNNDRPEIYGPIIKTKTDKRQNPFIAHKNRFAEWLLYRGFKKNKKLSLYMGFAINKIIRLLFIFNTALFFFKKRRCFSIHGAFLIFNYKALEKLDFKPYDKTMFLFYEELYLGTRCKKIKVPFYYIRNIKIKHFEDGTMDVSGINQKSEISKSYVTYYENLR